MDEGTFTATALRRETRSEEKEKLTEPQDT